MRLHGARHCRIIGPSYPLKEGGQVPRAKVKFNATSPNSSLWPSQPEEAVAELAKKNLAEYIPGSLVFSTGGHTALALFRTVEPGDDNNPTRLHQLGIDLDAIDVELFVGPENWNAGNVVL
jgi:hypothetical protein